MQNMSFTWLFPTHSSPFISLYTKWGSKGPTVDRLIHKIFLSIYLLGTSSIVVNKTNTIPALVGLMSGGNTLKIITNN